MEWSTGSFEAVRARLEKEFFGDEKEFVKTVLEFYRKLGFGKYYADDAEESITVKTGAIGAELVKIKVDDVTAVERKREKALEFSRAFSKVPVPLRVELAKIIAEEVENYTQAFALIFATDTGKPIQLGASEITGKGAQWAKWAAGAEALECLRPVLRHKNAEKRAANTPFNSADIVSLTIRVPNGDTAAIGGYNYLYALVINKLIQSIVTGNGTIIKAGQQGAHWVFLLVDKVIPAAIDKFLGKNLLGSVDANLFKQGLCQFVVGRRENDPFLQMSFLAFTGSDLGAEAIALERGVKRSVFERGGNSPVIICASFFAGKTDAECRKLARDLIAAMNNSGQRCTAPRQVYLLKAVEKTNFVEHLNGELGAACQDSNYLGNPYSFATKNGPVIDGKAARKMEELISKARDKNCVTIGGERILAGLHPDAIYLQPGAIYHNGANDEPQYCEEMRHEVFAPLLQIVQNISLEKAVEFNNNSPQQLAGAIFSGDDGEITFARENIKCGSLQVNNMPADPSPLAPHVDDSGHADGGVDSLRKYSRQQVIEGPYALIKKYIGQAMYIFSG